MPRIVPGSCSLSGVVRQFAILMPVPGAGEEDELKSGNEVNQTFLRLIGPGIAAGFTLFTGWKAPTLSLRTASTPGQGDRRSPRSASAALLYHNGTG
jgi:hypothetical protein